MREPTARIIDIIMSQYLILSPYGSSTVELTATMSNADRAKFIRIKIAVC